MKLTIDSVVVVPSPTPSPTPTPTPTPSEGSVPPPPSPTPSLAPPAPTPYAKLPAYIHTRLDEQTIINTDSEQSVYYGYQYFDAKYVPQLDKFVSLLGLSRYSYPVEGLAPGIEHIPFTFYYGDATQYEPNYPIKQPAPAFLDPQNRMSLVNVDNDNLIDQPQELPILAPFPTPSLSIFDDGFGNVSFNPVGQKMEIPVGAKFVSKLQDGPPVSQYVPPTPTPTPTISLTPEVTPTMTVTPEVTPTMTVTPEVTPTPSPAPALPEGVFSVGYDEAGQIGDGAGVSATGQFHNVMSWSETGDISSFVNLDGYRTIAMIVDGALFSWGENSTGSTGTGSLTGNVFAATNIGGAEPSWDMVVGGQRERFAIAGGKLYAWGLNTSGRLGLGDTTNRATPTQIGTDTDWSYVSTAGYFTYAIKTDGTLWSWGVNTSGQLGQGDTTPRNVPTQVGTSADWVKVIANDYNGSVYAINSSGELYACGNNFNGTLGLGDSGSGTNRTLLTRVGIRTDWQDVYPGVYSSAIIGRTADGIYSWGRGGGYGMLGISALNSVNEPTLVSNITDFTKIISNQEIFLALRANGEVYGWGYNRDYTLSPAGAAFDAVIETPTILSFPEPIVDIMCQVFHPMVYATSQNKLYAWGNNGDSGQARYAPGLPLIVSDATVLLDYTSLNKSPILVAQTTNSATFATKIIQTPQSVNLTDRTLEYTTQESVYEAIELRFGFSAYGFNDGMGYATGENYFDSVATPIVGEWYSGDYTESNWYEVRVTPLSGSFDFGSQVNTWLSLNFNLTFSLEGVSPGQTKEVVALVEIRNDQTLQVVDSATITMRLISHN